MDNNRKNEHDHTGLKKNRQLHFCPLEAFDKHKLVEDYDAG